MENKTEEKEPVHRGNPTGDMLGAELHVRGGRGTIFQRPYQYKG